MAKKADIRICRYVRCNHPNKEIDVTCDEFELSNKFYYHKDCFAAKKAESEKDEKVKNDLQLIKNLWLTNISNTVVFSQLFSCLNQLLAQGIESDYLVFTMEYCVSHKMNLRHPFGFKYFVDRQEIKDAYKKKQLALAKINQSTFSAADTDDSPKFTINQKPSGFGRILGGDKK